MMFVTHLARTLKASTIKVYLAGVRSLHIDHGFDNPLKNCLRLERVIRGVKREQGTGTRPRLPITAAILRRSNTFLTHSIIATHCSGQRVAPVSLAFCAVENSRQRRPHTGNKNEAET